MGKLIDEKVLQRYFKERYAFQDYSVEINGKKERISGVTDGPDFPDLNCTINGKTIPCEVEWLSSRFNHSGHKNYPDFKNKNGFLLVFKNDQPVSDLQQITVNEEDFKKWFKKNANKIFDESVNEFKVESRKQRKTAKIWIIYITKKMQDNYQMGFQKGVWGFQKAVPTYIIQVLQSIKKGDVLVNFGPTVNVETNRPIFARMKGKFADYNYHIKNEEIYKIEYVSVCKINKDYWNEEVESNREKRKYKVNWKDETQLNKKYPHRIGYSNELISESRDIKLKKLNDATNEFLRKTMQGIAISEMSYQNFVELIRQ